MRSGFLIGCAVLATAVFCQASTITDTFHQSQSGCSYSLTPPYGTCDVIGDPQMFDIESVTFSVSGGLANLLIEMNSGAVNQSGGQLVLAPFSDHGITLIPGDIFFYSPNTVYNPSDPLTSQYLKYGISLTNHGSFVAGGLYYIGGGVSVETAQTALGNPNAYYRKDQDVLMTGSGAPVSTGTIGISHFGNGSTDAQYAIDVSIPVTPGFTSLMSDGQVGIVFSAADCGNDVVQGIASQVPEPNPGILVLSGILLLFAGRLWRRRSAAELK